MTFEYYGGALITKPQLVLCFVSFESSSAQGPTLYTFDPYTRENVIDMMDDIVDSAYVDKISSEYSPAGGPVLERGSVIAVADFTMQLPATNPNAYGPVVSDPELRALLLAAIDTGQVPAPSSNTLYFLYTPSTVVVTLRGENSIGDFGGYHDYTRTSAGTVAWYAVVTGTSNHNDVDVLTKYSSHELASAITNPETGVRGWVDKGKGKEISDPCNRSPKRFHGWELNPFWLRSTNDCGMPVEDGLKKRWDLRIRGTVNCFGRAAEGSLVTFSATLKRGNRVIPIQRYSWTADGTAVGNQATQQIGLIAPPAGESLQVGLAATDGWGRTTSHVTAIQAVGLEDFERQSRMCRLVARFRAYIRPNRFADPLWDPLRDLAARPVQERDIAQLKLLHRAVEVFIREWTTQQTSEARREKSETNA